MYHSRLPSILIPCFNLSFVESQLVSERIPFVNIEILLSGKEFFQTFQLGMGERGPPSAVTLLPRSSYLLTNTWTQFFYLDFSLNIFRMAVTRICEKKTQLVVFRELKLI